MSEQATHWSEQLQQLRRARDLTQQQLADQIGCALTTIKKFERGERRPSRDIAARLADLFGMQGPERSAFIAGARAKGAEPAEAAPSPPPAPREINLPFALDEMFGRDQELESIAEMLRQPMIRLLTLAGPPGVGKSRLGIAAARHVARSGGVDVAFVNLVVLKEAQQVLPAIAQTLGIVEAPARDLQQVLFDYLQGRPPLLLVLDNFEHVLDAAAEIAEMLGRSPHLKALVTSRTMLQVGGEQVFTLEPLPLPAADASQLDEIAWSPAVKLFAARAHALDPKFRLSDANARSIARLCRWTDGLPLVIELTAAWVKLLPPPTLENQLQQRLPLLIHGRRDAPLHQQTLRRTIDWSVQRLPPAVQRLFARLSIFVGGADLDAIAAICGGEQPAAITLRLLRTLVEHNLVRYGSHRPASDPRMSMLVTLHEYASELLDQQGGAEQLVENYVDYYTQLFERIEPELTGPDQARWLQRLDQERSNLRSALERALAGADAAHALRLCAATWRYWLMRGLFTEGSTWFTRARASSADVEIPIQAKALLSQGSLYCAMADLPAAQDCGDQAIALYQAIGDRFGVAKTHNLLGIIALHQARYQRALDHLSSSLAYQRSQNNSWDIAATQSNIAVVLFRLQRFAEAQQALEESLRHRRALGDTSGVAVSLLNLGMVFSQQQRYQHAAQSYREALALFQQLEYLSNILSCLEAIAGLAAAIDSPHDSARLYSAVEAQRVQHSIPIQPTDVQDVEQGQRHARQHLHADEWEYAWDAGAQLSLIEVFELAYYILALALAQPAPAAEPAPRDVAFR